MEQGAFTARVSPVRVGRCSRVVGPRQSLHCFALHGGCVLCRWVGGGSGFSLAAVGFAWQELNVMLTLEEVERALVVLLLELFGFSV